MKLAINGEIIEKLPLFNVIAYTMDVENKNTVDVDNYLSELENEYQNKYNLDMITSIPKLKETRDGYKKLGKDPSHTRPACEALLRRCVKGLGIYRLGDIIDIGNIVSLLTLRSVCVVDCDKLSGNISIRLGKKDEPYEGINRGAINICNLPVYADDLGPFGTPTSDTNRTKITKETKSILIMIICFSDFELEQDEQMMLKLYQKYVHAKNINKIEVNYGKL